MSWPRLQNRDKQFLAAIHFFAVLCKNNVKWQSRTYFGESVGSMANFKRFALEFNAVITYLA